MSEITLRAIEQLLDKTLDDKFDEKLKPIRTDISGIRTGLALLATSEELSNVSTRLTTIEGILNQHTTTLDAIAKDVPLLVDEKTIAAARLDRLEKWAQQVGEKIGVKLDLQTLVP